jgi:nucleoside-diphosphate-sugar epimerase
VLGGTGFLGRVLAESWPAEALKPLYLVHRTNPDWAAHADVSLRHVDFHDCSDVRAAIAGRDVLINLLRPNGDGWCASLQRRLVPIFKEEGLRRCVHASSIDVYCGVNDLVVNEETPVEPRSPYEIEHCEIEGIIAEAAPELAVLRLGAVFGFGGRNIVSLAQEMAHASFLKLALRRALYGKRRMHLVSAGLAARALTHFALDARIDGHLVVLVTQDHHPDNNFAFVQDVLAEKFGRHALQSVPTLPAVALRLALRVRGVPADVAKRRFIAREPEGFGWEADNFADALRTYAQDLAAKAEERRG